MSARTPQIDLGGIDVQALAETVAAAVVAGLTAQLAPSEPAVQEPPTNTSTTKARTTARKTTARKTTARKTRKPARKPAPVAPLKGDLPWDGTKADRKRWNETLSAQLRLSGVRVHGLTADPNGTSLYRVVMDHHWGAVNRCRQEGVTPTEVSNTIVKAYTEAAVVSLGGASASAWVYV